VPFAHCYTKNTNKTQVKYNTQSMKRNMNWYNRLKAKRLQ